ncbi:hypothetical protein BV22DRAFT_1135467 [Leucogyrophana mollusca]|uniref:Uncharacterized protein n=1 Tax=Leucogyrophana mollusca TaxID=85980 RepID=A0ACB8AY75_9AGAM|nr:hypothetical protein BV22DRAFT_1135467 [Leucogyrophana mollusca]
MQPLTLGNTESPYWTAWGYNTIMGYFTEESGPVRFIDINACDDRILFYLYPFLTPIHIILLHFARAWHFLRIDITLSLINDLATRGLKPLTYTDIQAQLIQSKERFQAANQDWDVEDVYIPLHGRISRTSMNIAEFKVAFFEDILAAVNRFHTTCYWSIRYLVLTHTNPRLRGIITDPLTGQVGESQTHMRDLLHFDPVSGSALWHVWNRLMFPRPLLSWFANPALVEIVWIVLFSDWPWSFGIPVLVNHEFGSVWLPLFEGHATIQSLSLVFAWLYVVLHHDHGFNIRDFPIHTVGDLRLEIVFQKQLEYEAFLHQVMDCSVPGLHPAFAVSARNALCRLLRMEGYC